MRIEYQGRSTQCRWKFPTYSPTRYDFLPPCFCSAIPHHDAPAVTTTHIYTASRRLNLRLFVSPVNICLHLRHVAVGKETIDADGAVCDRR